MKQEELEERKSAVRPGQDLIMAGLAGFEGTRRIAGLHKEELRQRFSPVFLEDQLTRGLEAEETLRCFLAGGTLPVPEREISAWEAVGEGGVLAALWNFSGKMEAGIEFDLKKIPVRQITVEVSELFHLNPYRLLSAGAFVAAADNGARAAECLGQMGIPAAVIGRVTEGIARRMFHGGQEAGFLERPQPDEIEKVIKRRV